MMYCSVDSFSREIISARAGIVERGFSRFYGIQGKLEHTLRGRALFQ